MYVKVAFVGNRFEDFRVVHLLEVLDLSKGCLQKIKIAQNETFAYLGGRGVKKNSIYLHNQKWDINMREGVVFHVLSFIFFQKFACQKPIL